MELLLIDTYTEIIKRLRELIGDIHGIQTIHTATTYADAIDSLQHSMPHVVILDMDLPKNKSLDVIKHIKANKLNTKVIALSMDTAADTRQQAITTGADFFFDKFYEFDKIPAILSDFNKQLLSLIHI